MYQSTRDSGVAVSSAQAITQGISADGGLFVPQSIPELTNEEIKALLPLSYVERAKAVLAKFLTDFTKEELDACVSGAYAPGKFDDESVAPLAEIAPGVYMLELWHGPTCAFKDMALQMLPFLLTTASKKTVGDKTIVILVATSGDTGKAALEGFKDVKGTKILVFYPQDGVSPMQKLQMTTQEGGNVGVCAIKGNFDDAQTGVKAIFTDEAVAKKLKEHGMLFSSANSINWGRLAPQIVYYISAYCDLVKEGKVMLGDPINIVVPTGNFGNILAAYYAKSMGLPVAKLICASNSNNVLTDFLKTGVYDRNRPFFTTVSPSMDILISSNLERLLYDLSGRDDKKIRGYMESLAKTGRYEVDDAIKEKLNSLFCAGFCDDTATKETIGETFQSRGYLCDTHTAVALHVYEQYVADTEDKTPAVIASTASPFKFSASVLDAVAKEDVSGMDEFSKVAELSSCTKLEAPAALSSLKDKAVRFEEVCTKDTMEQVVLSMLGIS